MKPAPILPLLALACLLGACSSFSPVRHTQAAVPPRPAQLAGYKVTVWGERPSYDQLGHSFRGLGRPTVNTFDSKLTLDVLVNPDGSVHDVAIFESSGNASLDRRVAARFKHAHYSLRLAPDDPSPHVVRWALDFAKYNSPDLHPSADLAHNNLNGSGPVPTFAGPSSSRPGEAMRP
jgi:hypothetical protein